MIIQFSQLMKHLPLLAIYDIEKRPFGGLNGTSYEQTEMKARVIKINEIYINLLVWCGDVCEPANLNTNYT